MLYKISQAGEELLNEFEGFRPYPYKDVKGVPTIGYGTTTYPSGKKVSLKDSPVTEKEAIKYRDYFINNWIIPAIQTEVTVILTQNKVDALISFIYNVGPSAFETSHLLQRINHNDPCSLIIEEFKKWRKSGGKVIPGLVARREKESSYYCQNG